MLNTNDIKKMSDNELELTMNTINKEMNKTSDYKKYNQLEKQRALVGEEVSKRFY